MTWFATNSGWIGVVATVSVPVAVYLLGRKLAKKSTQQQEAIKALQDSQEKIAKSARRDEMIRLLPTVKPGLHLELLKRDMDTFKGTVDELPLAQALHSNIGEPFPSSGEIYFMLPVIDQIITTLGDRYGNQSDYEEYPDLRDFIIDCVTSEKFTQRDHSKFANRFAKFLATDNISRTTVSHSWVRNLITRGAWPMVAPLLYRTQDMPNDTSGGSKFNILCGVFLAIIDEADTDDSAVPAENGLFARNPPVAAPDRAAIHADVLQALADLIHRGTFNSYASWSQEGATDTWTACPSWLIEVVGIACRSDDHLEMRCIQGLPALLQSLVSDGEIVWGKDDKAIESGFKMIRDRCPVLWGQYGAELQELSGVRIT